MSYLNALASGGLTVGLNFYSSRLSGPSRADQAEAEPIVRGGQVTAAEEPSEISRSARPAAPAQTLEERAAGRAEAQAQLAAEGALVQLQPSRTVGEAPGGEERPTAGDGSAAVDRRGSGPAQELTEEEKRQVQDLARRDREVRAHEQAHVAASGGLAGAPHYEYRTGPDGKRYAAGGEVSVRRSGGGDLDQSLREAEAVKRGATAPAQPSSQDRAVAAAAAADIVRLKSEKAQQARTDEAAGGAEAKAPAAVSGDAGASILSRQALGAYAAVKFGPPSAARQLLAQV